jgi:hypothetical protein
MPEGGAEKVAKWMNTADLISVGGRIQVVEEGPDTCNSESDSNNEDHGEKLEGAYKGIPVDSHGDPIGSGHEMTNEQANMARAASRQASCSAPPPEPVQLNPCAARAPEQSQQASSSSGKEKSGKKGSSEGKSQERVLATRRRFRVNGYVCDKWSPFQNLSRNLFLRGGFLSLAIQQVQWTSATLLSCHSQGVIDCITP